jgi:DNA-binding MarR family transcriptional regulator
MEVVWVSMEPNWLSPDEDRAWRAFVFAQRQLVAHLNRGLEASGLSGADYAVLVALSAIDGDRMSARELCTTLDWEKSRLSHQLRRMQQDGLISRELNPDDARSTMVRLLPAGRAAIERAAPRHVQDVRRNFINVFTPAELDTIATLNERIMRHLAAPDGIQADGEASTPSDTATPVDYVQCPGFRIQSRRSPPGGLRHLIPSARRVPLPPLR